LPPPRRDAERPLRGDWSDATIVEGAPEVRADRRDGGDADIGGLADDGYDAIGRSGFRPMRILVGGLAFVGIAAVIGFGYGRLTSSEPGALPAATALGHPYRETIEPQETAEASAPADEDVAVAPDAAMDVADATAAEPEPEPVAPPPLPRVKPAAPVQTAAATRPAPATPPRDRAAARQTADAAPAQPLDRRPQTPAGPERRAVADLPPGVAEAVARVNAGQARAEDLRRDDLRRDDLRRDDSPRSEGLRGDVRRDEPLAARDREAPRVFGPRDEGDFRAADDWRDHDFDFRQEAALPAEPALIPPAAIPDAGPVRADDDFFGPGDEILPALERAVQRDVVPDWHVVQGSPDFAILDGRNAGIFEVEIGSVVPGLGRVRDIVREDGRWVVRTDSGTILPMGRRS
jgi:hypothetical protein